MIVYSITNKVNKKRYIGMTKNTIYERYRLKWWVKIKNEHIKASVAKYGHENFEIEILAECTSLEELSEKEKYFIKVYKTLDSNYGYNKAPGGLGGDMGVEGRRKVSDSLKKHFKDSNNLKRLSDNQTKYIRDNPDKVKETNRKIKETCGTEEARNNNSIRQGNKPFKCFDKEGNYVGTWCNNSKCARDLGVQREKVRDCLHKKRNHTGGYRFCYIEEKENG